MASAVVWLGLLLGLRHALEPDHLAAVASLAAGSARPRELIRVAAAWGLGHALVLVAAGMAMVGAGAAFPLRVDAALEVVVGGVLILLGAGVLRRLFRARAQKIAAPAPRASITRAFLIGALHGIEGSGAVVLLALPALHSPRAAFAYLALFGFGSIAGMLACSLALAVPLGAARRLTWTQHAVQFAAGAAAVAVGGAMVLRHIG